MLHYNKVYLFKKEGNHMESLFIPVDGICSPHGVSSFMCKACILIYDTSSGNIQDLIATIQGTECDITEIPKHKLIPSIREKLDTLIGDFINERTNIF